MFKPSLTRSLALVILWMSFVSSGCAPSIRDALNPETLQASVSQTLPIKVDVEASEIIWKHPVNVRDFKPLHLRRDIGRALEEAMNSKRGYVVDERGYIPVRYLLEVHEVSGQYLWFVIPCFFYLTIFGCPTHSLDAEITLTVEYQGSIYTASTEGGATFNLYNFLSFGGRSELSPVADGLRQAIQRLAQQMRGQPRSQPKLKARPVARVARKVDINDVSDQKLSKRQRNRVYLIEGVR